MLLSVDAKVYRLSTGSRATWNSTVSAGGLRSSAAPANLDEITGIRGDLTIPTEKVKAELKIKGRKHVMVKGTLIMSSISFSLIYDPAQADFIALQTAWLTSVPISLALLDGDKATVGTQGVWADYEVTKFEKGEVIDDIQMTNVEIGYAYTSVAPEDVVVA